LSKRDLQKYLKELTKNQLQDQILDLYDRFKEVKVFYDFAFNPKEDKLLDDFKTRVGKEYFPLGNRKPKMRRSVAQKLIKHFITIEVDPTLLLDAMLFNIETAQAYTQERTINQEAFYKSMLVSFRQAVNHAKYHGILSENLFRINRIVELAAEQNWMNAHEFAECLSD